MYMLLFYTISKLIFKYINVIQCNVRTLLDLENIGNKMLIKPWEYSFHFLFHFQYNTSRTLRWKLEDGRVLNAFRQN